MQLREQDRHKDEFLGLLGHELRNPLTAIYSATEILRYDNQMAPHGQQSIALISRQVKHLLRLVDDLLSLTRITHGQIELKKVPLDLADGIHRAVELVRPQLEARRHRLELNLPKRPLYTKADPERITQILANLLSNAIQYTNAGGRITVSAQRAKGTALIRVRDNGIGFTPEQLPQLFETFRRLKFATENYQSGLGLGLPLARQLAQLHGGSLEAFSAGPGQGSEFTLRLPALPPIQSTEPAQTSADGEIHSRARRILLVEDEEAVADSLATLLRLQNHEVKIVFRGGQTLEAIREFHPELVLLDIGLPDISGYEVAQRLRQEPGLETLPLVALTGYGREEDVQQAQASGFDRHLLKPASLETLQTLLREL